MRNTHSTTNPPTTTPHLVYSVDLCAVLSRSVVSDSFRPHGLWRARLLCLRRFSRPEYWSGMPCPFAGELSNPGIELPNPGLPHCRWILYHLSHQGSLSKLIRKRVYSVTLSMFFYHKCLLPWEFRGWNRG